jgi:hypothetical protein
VGDTFREREALLENETDTSTDSRVLLSGKRRRGMSTRELYISIDVETDGPIPGQNSMLSLGAAAFLPGDPEPVASFSRNLRTLVDASPDPDTTKWWKTQPEAWKVCRENPEDPGFVMGNFKNWVESISQMYEAKPVCVAYPSGFDFLFVYWYLIRFTKESPFSFSCIDIKTYAMSMLKKGYRECSKKGMPKEWFPEDKHTHRAIDDAIEQGKIFMNILKENAHKVD